MSSDLISNLTEAERPTKRAFPYINSMMLLVLALGLPKVLSSQSLAAKNEHFDRPAELPREYVISALKNTPSNGKMLRVDAGKDPERILDGASCGDTVELQAGATFSGNITFPAKNCDDSHWIIVRTSAPDSSLPAEGTRLAPCFAGIASLPGRPPLGCVNTTNVLAKIELKSAGGPGPVIFAAEANHYRLIGLEITRASSPTPAQGLVHFKGRADHIIFDRVWIHGTPQDENVRGILLGQTRHVAIIDSFFSDFHCIAMTSSCTDSQAILGGIGDGPMGPYKIVNNFLEASGENIMFGGGRAGATPQDIEIRHNFFFKPLTWMMGQAGYVGGTNGNPFIVKNIFELKNAQRVLFEGNVLENCWGGFTQDGFAILLTPKNPGGCESCQVTDVTVRYNSIRHVGAGLQIANALSGGGIEQDGQRYSIHDLIMDDIDDVKFNGAGEFAQISVASGAPLLQNVRLDHITAFPSRRLFIIGDMVTTSTPIRNFVFANSIVTAGLYPVWSTGGGRANCAFHNHPATTFEDCFVSSTFSPNVILQAPPAYPPADWPANNFFPSSVAAVQFVNYSNGRGGDYHLKASSPFKGKGTDGRDLGADINATDSATLGVEQGVYNRSR